MFCGFAVAALLLVDPVLDRAVAAAATVPLERIEQAAGDVPADSEQHEAATHQQGEHQIGELHQTAALSSQVEQHAGLRPWLAD